MKSELQEGRDLRTCASECVCVFFKSERRREGGRKGGERPNRTGLKERGGVGGREGGRASLQRQERLNDTSEQ